MTETLIRSVGSADAITDLLLPGCFIRTPLIQNCLSFNSHRNLIVGKKGSGKSAIFRIGLGSASKIPVLRISPDSHEFKIRSSDLSHHQYKHIIGYELLLECLHMWKDLPEVEEMDGASKIKASIEGYLDKLKDLGVQLKNVDLNLFGLALSIEGDRYERLGSLVYQNELQALYPLVTRFTEAGAKCLVLIDDPEDFCGTDGYPSINFLSGLIFAAKSINFHFSGAIRVVLFLKLHVYIYFRPKFENFDKIYENVSMLRWDNAELKSMICSRLAKAFADDDQDDEITRTWKQIIHQPESDESNRFLSFLLDRLVCGPRDLIRFTQMILDRQYKGVPFWDTVSSAEAEYSREQLAEVRAEYGKEQSFVYIDKVLKLFFHADLLPTPESRFEMKKGDFLAFLKKRLDSKEIRLLWGKYAWLDGLTAMRFTEILFNCGIIGYYSEKEKRFILPYEVSYDFDELNASARWRINPAFYKEFGFA